MGKKRSKSAKKAKAGNQTALARDEELTKAPHSFVFHRGDVGRHMRALIRDMRRVMEPYTATRLQMKKSNTLKDLTSVAGVLHVSHFLMFTKTDLAPYLRILRVPRGPTLTFKIMEYCLSRDVLSSHRRPNVEQSAFQTPPLLVLNSFSGDQLELKLMSTMFQNMFPSINVNKVNLNSIRRCVLVNYNKDSKLLDFRHYLIKVAPVGISKSIKKLTRPKLPNMSNYTSINEYVEKDGNLSESEGEVDGPHNEVILPQEIYGRGNIKSTQSAIRLKEIGPRLQLQLVKIEEGMCDGAILYHEFVHKSQQEQQSLKEIREQKRKLKEQRKKEQLKNVKRKLKLKEEHKAKSLEGIKKKQQHLSEAAKQVQAEQDSEDDDVEFFKNETGQEPDKELFPQFTKGRKRKFSSKHEQQGSKNGKKRLGLESKIHLKKKFKN